MSDWITDRQPPDMKLVLVSLNWWGEASCGFRIDRGEANSTWHIPGKDGWVMYSDKDVDGWMLLPSSVYGMKEGK